jgi:hypothetical protein
VDRNQKASQELAAANSAIATLEATVARRDRLTEYFVMRYSLGPLQVHLFEELRWLNTSKDDVAKVFSSMAL